MIMHCSIQKNASLFDIIGYDAEVTCLTINNINFGDSNGHSKLEISLDKLFLKIYTEDEYISVAKMHIEDIEEISFSLNQQNYTLERWD